MAASGDEQAQRSKERMRIFFVVEEWCFRHLCVCGDKYVVFKINLKGMFASAAVDEQEDWVAATRSFPRPIVEFKIPPEQLGRFDVAAVSGRSGPNIIAVSSLPRTVIYDAAAAAAAAAEVPCAPELRERMSGGGFALVPMGDRLYAITNSIARTSHGCAAAGFQALLPSAQPSSHDRWSWRSLPAPPRDLYERQPFTVAAFVAVGTRVWMSTAYRVTYSFDTACLTWRKEGNWELPLEGRGLFVPDLGLCFGIFPPMPCL